MRIVITHIERFAVSPRDHRHPAGMVALGALVALALFALVAPFIETRGPSVLAMSLLAGSVAAFIYALEGGVFWSALVWSLATGLVSARLIFVDFYAAPDPVTVMLFAATVQAGALLVLTAPVWLASWRARLPALVTLLSPAVVIFLIFTTFTVEHPRDSAILVAVDLLALPLAVLARRIAFRERLAAA
ncbi:hypothetical protein QO010_003767 [Caulobacter ginsengisoli]|uniref:Uncharacterized protein n=1 Tax=Caulobacter ginsengisoli TaxID=400775 RepID=A0ABU0IY39_9CAUL|nr:hypothetical protein [Caulobacter ginsengisoli]MDQ0465974.1 hypothetical protein [Caulobacter ginsengisoli]